MTHSTLCLTTLQQQCFFSVPHHSVASVYLLLPSLCFTTQCGPSFSCQADVLTFDRYFGSWFTNCTMQRSPAHRSFCCSVYLVFAWLILSFLIPVETVRVNFILQTLLLYFEKIMAQFVMCCSSFETIFTLF